ncbi:hypothetical protein [Pseudomonas purpurea]|uniref:hypothetical protein n=1 Tax=Pseudomonas purpurea TaxID=3136737 RepID=UPI0032669D51
MTVFLLLYLCTDASRADCQVILIEHWKAPDAYEQCSSAAKQLTVDLTAKNRQRDHFVCEIQASGQRSPNPSARPDFSPLASQR